MFGDSGFWIIQALNSLQLAMLLFLLSVGLSVIFGLMNFVNLAHGSFYALGAFIGYTIASTLGSYWAAFLLAPIAVAGIGAVLYVLLINRMRTAGPMKQILVTFGLIFVLLDIMRYIWGNDQLGLPQTGVAHRRRYVAPLQRAHRSARAERRRRDAASWQSCRSPRR